MILDIKIRGDRIFCDTEELASGSEQTVDLRFDMDHAWDGYTGTAVMFRSFGTQYCVPLQGGGCPVPSALLKGTGRLYIGVFGSRDEKIITTGFTSVALFGGASDGNMPDPPEAYVYTRLLDMVSDAVEGARELRLDVESRLADHETECENSENDRRLAESARRDAEMRREEAEEKRRLAEADREAGCVTESYLHSYIDATLGDISAALDELHAYAEAIAEGGVSV